MEIAVKYAGYIRRQEEGVARLRHLEHTRIPDNLNYTGVSGLSVEIQEKLSALRPPFAGPGGSHSGRDPAAVSLLAIHLKKGSLQAQTA